MTAVAKRARRVTVWAVIVPDGPHAGRVLGTWPLRDEAKAAILAGEHFKVVALTGVYYVSAQRREWR